MKRFNRSIIRIICVLMALFCNIHAHAADECDWFNVCDDIDDTWPSTPKIFHGQTIPARNRSYSSDCFCPPYNKDDGRHGCLLRKDAPGKYNMAYINICAEDAGAASNYFAPTIKYRHQACNIACWTSSGVLRGNGECDTVPSPYGVPLLRLCARMALPAQPASGRPGESNYREAQPADEGYVVDAHLDIEGFVVDDNPISNGGYNPNGTPKGTPDPALQPPKICLYWDPDLLDTLANYGIQGIISAAMIPVLQDLGDGRSAGDVANSLFDPDFVDYNPTTQPEHHASGIDPTFKAMINALEGLASLEDGMASMINSTPDYIQYSDPYLLEYEYLLKGLSWFTTNVAVEVLKFIGTLNRVVAASFGCVNVPLGPFPPPYCPTIQKNLSIPTTYPICATTVLNNGTAMLQQSSKTNPCTDAVPACAVPIPYGLCVNPVIDGERNNVVHNSIRVGFTDFKPLCVSNGGAKDLTQDGKCVNINGTLSAKELYRYNSNTGTIKLCSAIPAPQGETPCVESTYLHNLCAAGSTASYCKEGLRVVYSVNSNPTEYYDQLLPDCDGGSKGCQSVWGVNFGSFADLVVTFQADDGADPKWSAPVKLVDPSNHPHTYYAAIPRKEMKIGAGTSAQESSQICVYEVNGTSFVAIGCNSRATPPKPKLRSCNGAACTSSFFDPRMIVKVEVPVINSGTSDFTEGSLKTEGTLSLAAYNYSAYSTDKTHAKKPFVGPHSLFNGAIVYGNYVGNQAPYDPLGNPINNPAPIYLNGIEYFKNVYQIGAEYICLTGYKFDDCLTGDTRQNCVLSELFNSDVMGCSAFKGLTLKYPGIDVCDSTKEDLTCVNSGDSFDGINLNTKIYIKDCTSGATGFVSKCYDYGAQNGRLCEPSTGGFGRIVPLDGCDNAVASPDTLNLTAYDGALE